jgi:methylthioribose-1-phosphate isomerase
MNTDFKTIEYRKGKLKLIDQTKLPLEEKYIITDDYNRIAEAIEKLEVRGAPAIGVAAAYALAIGINRTEKISEASFQKICERIGKTRPTAVNLFWAIERMKNVFNSYKNSTVLKVKLIEEAIKIHNEDIDTCRKISENGQKIFKTRSTVLTHCNTGKLATGGEGTALGIIILGYKRGLVEFVYADETRPLLQGSRLTAFELDKAGVPFSLNTDSTSAVLIKENKIDAVIVGSDRIASNGDAANKIGTYNLAVLCKYHKIPFYIAAPTSTVDRDCKTGHDIEIEFRDKSELNSIMGNLITSERYDVYSPAFDVTPNELITGIVTEIDLHEPPYNFENI